MLRTFDFQKTPIADIINEILVDASKRNASDIHFDPYEEYLLVRVRIDGDLYDYTKVPNSSRDYLVTRIKTISKMNITESRRPQDGAIKTTIKDTDLDLRVSALPVSNGEKIVIRILDYTRSMAGIDELGFSADNYEKLLEMISVPNGIILVTGATGSGKSTTVYSILQFLNRSTTNIITVEDPIEMDIKGVNQVQVNSNIGLTFASALRSILRQDPNIIMIGEIRDTETAKIAVRASITGHLVLSTIHTNNSLNTIERLIDMDVAKYLLASALEGIISQKLARKLCDKCRVKRKTTEFEKQIFKVVTGNVPEEIYEAEGCEECHSGFKGRIAVQEVLIINQDIRDALSEDVPKEKLREMVYGSGVTTLLADGLNKVAEGLTTFGEIINLIELDSDNNVVDDEQLKEAIILAKQQHASKEVKVKEDEEKQLSPISNGDVLGLDQGANIKVDLNPESMNNTPSQNVNTGVQGNISGVSQNMVNPPLQNNQYVANTTPEVNQNMVNPVQNNQYMSNTNQYSNIQQNTNNQYTPAANNVNSTEVSQGINNVQGTNQYIAPNNQYTPNTAGPLQNTNYVQSGVPTNNQNYYQGQPNNQYVQNGMPTNGQYGMQNEAATNMQGQNYVMPNTNGQPMYQNVQTIPEVQLQTITTPNYQNKDTF